MASESTFLVLSSSTVKKLESRLNYESDSLHPDRKDVRVLLADDFTTTTAEVSLLCGVDARVLVQIAKIAR